MPSGRASAVVSFIWVFSEFVDRMDVGKQQGERGQLVEGR